MIFRFSWSHPSGQQSGTDWVKADNLPQAKQFWRTYKEDELGRVLSQAEVNIGRGGRDDDIDLPVQPERMREITQRTRNPSILVSIGTQNGSAE